jgi:hypothetical protein
VYDPTLDVDGWWNLDAYLPAPEYIGSDDFVSGQMIYISTGHSPLPKARRFLSEITAQGCTQLFLVQKMNPS